MPPKDKDTYIQNMDIEGDVATGKARRNVSKLKESGKQALDGTKGVGSALVGLLKTGTKKLKRSAKSTGSRIKSSAKSTGSRISKRASSASESTRKASEMISAGLKELFRAVSNKAKKVGSSVKGKASAASSKVRGKLSSAKASTKKFSARVRSRANEAMERRQSEKEQKRLASTEKQEQKNLKAVMRAASLMEFNPPVRHHSDLGQTQRSQSMGSMDDTRRLSKAELAERLTRLEGKYVKLKGKVKQFEVETKGQSHVDSLQKSSSDKSLGRQ